MFCSKCGKELEDGAAFCQFCGQKQTEDSSEKTEKEAGKREEQIGNKQLLLAGVVIAAVILAVIAGFKLVVGDRKEKAAGEIATQETAQEENASGDDVHIYYAGDKPVFVNGYIFYNGMLLNGDGTEDAEALYREAIWMGRGNIAEKEEYTIHIDQLKAACGD